MTVTLPQYAETLRRLIEKPKSHMLLNAREMARTLGGDTKGAAFELASGRFQKEFITLWELFDQREDFKVFVKMFAEKAQEIRRSTSFTAIVTSTATAKHVVEHVHAAIETDRDKVAVHYLGDYPFLNLESRNLLDFKNEKVLIVTDVIASGNLARRMVEIVEEVGGKPVGVLCVVVTSKKLIEEPFLEYGKSTTKKRVHIHTLAARPIRSLEPPEIAKLTNIIKIDPITILPKRDVAVPNGFYPKFDTEDMFSHLESAEALDFNFYQWDFRKFTTAVRIERLLQRHGKKIWRAIRDKIPADSTLVTTFDRDDIIFKEFVEDNLPKQKTRRPIVFVPKHNSLETVNSYFLLPASLEHIEHHDVVLLLSSVSTSERLRNIVSLLASTGVASITVICLFNRMGPNTSSFISRIKKLLRGVGRDEGNSRKRHAGFEFHFLYSLPDLSSDDLAEMQQTVEALFTYFAGQTRVASFRRWMSQDHKYFRPHSVTSSDFERPINHTKPLAEKFKLAIENGSSDASPPKEIEVGTPEGKLALLCSRLVAQRDYEPVIRELAHLSDKETLYKLFGILLSDLSYLKMTGRFAALRAALIAEVRKLRAVRFAHEDLSRELGVLCDLSLIEAAIDTETYLLFGLSLFSFLDHEYDYEYFVRETLTCGLDLERWSKRPCNFSLYMGEERSMWCLSMLLHFSQHNFRHPEVATDLKARLESEIDGLVKGSEQVLPGEERKESRQKVKANLNLLLTELGVHDLKAKHQVIRYLQSKIIAVRRGHNPIYSSLETALRELRSVVDFADTAESGEDGNRRVRILETKTKKVLEDAIYTVGILEEISDAIRQLVVHTDP